MPINHYKRWTREELEKIKAIAKTLPNKTAMYGVSPIIASQFGRTESSVCNKIEEINKCFWGRKK